MSWDGDRDGDVRELRRLLAVPAERDLPAGRRIQREEHLMRSWRTMDKEGTGGREHGRRVRRRFAWGLAAASIVAGVAVAVPGGTETPAYAVEKNPDGTLTISIRDLDWWGDPQHFERLAREIRAAGFTAIVDKIPAGKTCRLDRGTPLNQRKTGDGKWGYQYVMTHADAYVVEEYLPGSGPKGSDMRRARAFRYMFFKGQVKPCDPVSRPQLKPPR
ncbi:hypothetical protein [Streptomyces sp. DSM 40750]|uniref:hypothetical protein n=1 Tax=Streptomyces sp. DSM 40750 TaxID=2801030 RepID=UPI00214B4474|nr:hypothetical protein [Streptomyces sp. DSM 40750]UUU25686.1 hypothetical protein JIX55_38570 [Streptomyces sp. DSM 40750]